MPFPYIDWNETGIICFHPLCDGKVFTDPFFAEVILENQTDGDGEYSESESVCCNRL